MAFFNEFPHTRTYDNDLGWIIKTIKALEENLQNFIKLNTVKYADPIQWDISKQYESNTVVIDDLTGVAYISTQPVPSGVNINNTDYWTPVFTLDLVNLNKNITLRNDGDNHNATFASVVGDWVIIGGQLYKVIQDIGLHTAYVVGFNIEIYTVELFVRDYFNRVLTTIGDLQDLTTADKSDIVNAINSVLSDLNTKVGDLQDLQTEDKTSVVNAINTVLSDLNTKVGDLNTKVGDLDKLNTSDKTSVVNAINSNIHFVTPQMFGAVGDGVNDDTQALTACFANDNIFIPSGTYLISARIEIGSNKCIIGATNAVIKSNFNDKALMKITGGNVSITNLTFEGIKPVKNGASEYNHGLYLAEPNNVHIDKCTFRNLYGDGVYMGSDGDDIPSGTFITNCTMSHCGRNGISIISNSDFVIDNCLIEFTEGFSPMRAIDIEPNKDGSVVRGVISNIVSRENHYGSLDMYINVSATINVVIDNIVSYKDCKDDNYPSMLFRNNIETNYGSVIVKNATLEQPSGNAGAYFHGWNTYCNMECEITLLRPSVATGAQFFNPSGFTTGRLRLHLNVLSPSSLFTSTFKATGATPSSGSRLYLYSTKTPVLNIDDDQGFTVINP